MTILDKMSVEDLLRVRKMAKDEAERYFDSFGLTHEDKLVARKLVQVKDKHHDNRLWLATAWLLGASFAQLARDKGVTKQSVMVQVDKILPKEERDGGRVSGIALSLESLSEYKVMFFENVSTLTDFTPKEAALWLLSNTSLDGDEEVGSMTSNEFELPISPPDSEQS